MSRKPLKGTEDWGKYLDDKKDPPTGPFPYSPPSGHDRELSSSEREFTGKKGDHVHGSNGKNPGHFPLCSGVEHTGTFNLMDPLDGLSDAGGFANKQGDYP